MLDTVVAQRALETADCLCGKTGVSGPPVRAKDELSGEPFDYVRCAGCGLERCSPRPVPDVIGSYYPTTYYAYAVRPASLTTRVKRRLVNAAFWNDENRLGPLRPLVRSLLLGRSLLAFRPPPGRHVFEFGAAAGNDLALFREAGWTVSGCEPSAQGCAVAAQRGITLQNCLAEQAVMPSGGVSCVLLNNVFEHLHDPVAILRATHAALEPDGVLMLIVPNHDGWAARLFGARFPGYDAPRHLWGFSPRPLSDLLSRNGFHVEHIYQRAPSRWAWQSALDGRHAAERPPAWQVNASRWLGRLLQPFGVLGAICGHGDFIKVVARRLPG